MHSKAFQGRHAALQTRWEQLRAHVEGCSAYLVVGVQQEEGGGEQGVALGDEVQPGVLPKVGRVVGPHALQLHVQHHLRPSQPGETAAINQPRMSQHPEEPLYEGNRLEPLIAVLSRWRQTDNSCRRRLKMHGVCEHAGCLYCTSQNNNGFCRRLLEIAWGW